MARDLDHIRQQVERARRWAGWMPDPRDRERLEEVARDYEKMVQTAEQARNTDAFRYDR